MGPFAGGGAAGGRCRVRMRAARPRAAGRQWLRGPARAAGSRTGRGGARPYRSRRRADRHRRPWPAAPRTTWSRVRSTDSCSPARSGTPSSARAPTTSSAGSTPPSCSRPRTPGSSAACCRRPIPRPADQRRHALSLRPRGGPRRRLLRRVETPDGRLHVLVGDVAGHGPDEAALGVALRIAWRTLVMADVEDRTAPADPAERARPRTELRRDLRDPVHGGDRPGTRTRRLFLAGHPAPLLLGTSRSESCPTTSSGRRSASYRASSGAARPWSSGALAGAAVHRRDRRGLVSAPAPSGSGVERLASWPSEFDAATTTRPRLVDHLIASAPATCMAVS